MTIYFHAGTPNTGSTSLQLFLKINSKAIAEEGFVYPSLFGMKKHSALTAYSLGPSPKRSSLKALGLTDKDAVEDFTAQLEQEFRDSFTADTNYILSNEHWGQAHLKTDLQRLKALFDSTGHDTKVIMYFRDPFEYLASSYSTRLKHGSSTPLHKPAKWILDRKYDYLNICDSWTAEFGEENFIARLFVRENLDKGDIRTDFLKILNIPAETADKLDYPDTRMNRRLDCVTAGIVAEYIEGTLKKNGKALDANLRDVIKACEAMPAASNILIPRRVRLWLQDALSDKLATFNKKYLKGEETWPFPPYKIEGKKMVRPPSEEAIAVFLEELEKRKAQQADA